MKLNRIFASFIVCTMLTGCSNFISCPAYEPEATDLIASRNAIYCYDAPDTPVDEIFISAQTEFAAELFRKSVAASVAEEEKKNILISPLSVDIALAMTANGADGDTLTEMEEVLGMPVAELNAYLYSYMNSLPSAEKYKLGIANSIWFKSGGLSVEDDFLSAADGYYGAQVYEAPFDKTTLRDINQWVSHNTDGMIDKIIDNIPDAAVMYLINALVFDAEWENVYKADDILDRTFTSYDGKERDIELMRSTEHVYLSDENAEGFVRYYKDKKYAFAALLPDDGVDIYDYIDSLTAEKVSDIFENAQDTAVIACVPKFEAEFSTEMNGILAEMGMLTAFDLMRADFSRLGQSANGNIFISRVLHKTYISVDSRGTKAAAVTSVQMDCGSAAPMEIHEVVLNRPFVYMILDVENDLPLFIGCVIDTGK